MITLGLYALLLATTAVLAGFVPALLFFGGVADRKVFIVGGVATAAAWVAVSLGLPTIASVTVNNLSVYPVWAVILGFPIAGFWKLGSRAAPAPRTEADRIAEIQARAREKARRLSREQGD
jgi:hypothetical protein